MKGKTKEIFYGIMSSTILHLWLIDEPTLGVLNFINLDVIRTGIISENLISYELGFQFKKKNKYRVTYTDGADSGSFRVQEHLVSKIVSVTN